MKKLILLTALTLLAVDQINAQCPAGETEVTMTVITDRYGDETTWTITGPGGSPAYASGGPYTLAAANGEYPQTPVMFCAPNGATLLVTVDDTYGDGMCCAYGNGSWTVSVGGVDVASGGTFTDTETATVVLGTDLGITALNVNSVILASSVNIVGTVTNGGITPITSFDLSYSVDGGTPIVESFSNTVNVGASYNFSHSTPWNATVGPHSVVLTLSNVAGDANANNNTYSGAVNVATQSVQRMTVMEEFGSSTCPPCEPVAAQLAIALPAVNANIAGSNVAAVGYAMNWPSPGNDPSYNPDGNTRKTYYGVTGIPNAFLDGMDLPVFNVSAASFQSTFNSSAAEPAFMDVDVSVMLNGNAVDVTATITPYADFVGTHKLHLVATEDSYSYTGGTTGQTGYHHIQRKMLPNAQGTTVTLTAGTPVTVTETYTFTQGSVAQGNYNLWGSLGNVSIVAFVQNNNTKEIIQADVANADIVGVEENELDRNIRVFPNPTNGIIIVGYDLNEGASIQMDLYNMLGEVVLSVSGKKGNGPQQQILDMSAFNNGLYYMSVTDGVNTSVRKVTLNK